MAKYRKKPVVVEAILWDGGLDTFMTIRNSDFNKLERSLKAEKGVLLIHTLEGIHEGQIGDWIISGVNGEIYPCKPDVFEKTYEPAN